jgi:hypothetical protein
MNLEQATVRIRKTISNITEWWYLLPVLCRSRIAQWYSAELRDGWSGSRVSAGAENFSLYHRVQTDSGSHPNSYPVGIRGSFSGVRRPGCLAEHSSPSSVEVKEWVVLSIPPLLQYAFMAWYSVKKRRTGTSCFVFTETVVQEHEVSLNRLCNKM